MNRRELAETGEKNGDGMICKREKELVGWLASVIRQCLCREEFERRVMDADTFGGEDEFAAFRPRASQKKKQKQKKQKTKKEKQKTKKEKQNKQEEDNKLMPYVMRLHRPESRVPSPLRFRRRRWGLYFLFVSPAETPGIFKKNLKKI